MSTASISVDELLSRAVAEVVDKNHLRQALSSGRTLRVKFGIDPTAREIHLGHAVPIRLLRRFQFLGHKIVFIVGDITAMIGNPLDRSATRTALTFEQTRANAVTYFDQAFKILDREETEIHYNSEWFHDFDLKRVIGLLAHSSVSQLTAHETFRERLKREQPFFAHELLYPLLQGYDSIAVKADVEVGGIEEKFNLLTGRELQKAYDQEPQDIVMTEYLVGTDGKEKMSKSLGNYIALTDNPAEMYGKVMSVPDELIEDYFRLATDVTDEALILIRKELKGGERRRDVKMRLAKTIVELYHGADKAEEAEDAFKTKFMKVGPLVADREVPILRGQHTVVDLLIASHLAKSKSEARRKIQEGAVEVLIGEEKQHPLPVSIKVEQPVTLRLGKRFVRILPHR